MSVSVTCDDPAWSLKTAPADVQADSRWAQEIRYEGHVPTTVGAWSATIVVEDRRRRQRFEVPIRGEAVPPARLAVEPSVVGVGTTPVTCSVRATERGELRLDGVPDWLSATPTRQGPTTWLLKLVRTGSGSPDAAELDLALADSQASLLVFPAAEGPPR
jgi:hypothetical protein